MPIFYLNDSHFEQVFSAIMSGKLTHILDENKKRIASPRIIHTKWERFVAYWYYASREIQPISPKKYSKIIDIDELIEQRSTADKYKTVKCKDNEVFIDRNTAIYGPGNYCAYFVVVLDDNGKQIFPSICQADKVHDGMIPAAYLGTPLAKIDKKYHILEKSRLIDSVDYLADYGIFHDVAKVTFVYREVRYFVFVQELEGWVDIFEDCDHVDPLRPVYNLLLCEN